MQTPPASPLSNALSLAELDASDFARRYWNEPRKAMEALTASSLSSIVKPQIKTIATYYHRLYQGGTENVMRALASLWDNAGYRVVVIVDEGTSLDEAPLPPAVDVRAIPAVPENEPDRFSERIDALAAILDEYEADVFVYHAWNSGWLPWDMATAKMHDCAFVIACSSIFSLREITADPYFAVQPFSFAAADAVACLSEADKAFWGSFNGNTYKVLNPLDRKLFNAPSSPLDGSTLVWVGRFSEEKRPEDAIRILAKVREQIPKARLTMLGTGEGPDYDQRLQQLAEELGVEEAVDFCGFVDNVSDYCQKSDLTLVTSEYEGFHLALFEALAHGVPAITYRLPNLSWIEGTEGVLTVPQKAVNEAARAAVALLSDRDALRHAGMAAREHALSFESVNIVEIWNQIFASLGHERPAPSATPGQKTMWEVLLNSYTTGIHGLYDIHAHEMSSAWEQVDAEWKRVSAEWDHVSEDRNRLNEDRDRLLEERNRLAEERAQLASERDRLANSISFRVGRAITWLPRKVRTVCRVLVGSGPKGVIDVCKEKLRRDDSAD